MGFFLTSWPCRLLLALYFVLCLPTFICGWSAFDHRRFRSRRTCCLFAASFCPQQQNGAALYTQVISDVDDTIKSSGGVAVAGIALGGIDVQYPRGAVYPGVAEFYLQLSIGPTNNNKFPPMVAILTARAKEFKAALQFQPDSPIVLAFEQRKRDYPNWGLGPILYGSVAEWIVQDRKGRRKFANFERLVQQDETGRILQYVYVGDTGELDQEAGETMLREYPQVVKAVFLHCVQDQPGPMLLDDSSSSGWSISSSAPAKWIQGRPIVFFRTYVGAAVAAVGLELISLEGLNRVVEAALRELQPPPPGQDDGGKWEDLHRDVTRARKLLERQS